MATQWTAGTTSGQVLTAATLNTIGAEWETYTPALTASTTNPTLGTGSSVAGRYGQVNKIVCGQGKIDFGTAGVAAGSGFYYVSLPIAAQSSGKVIGQFQFYDSSTLAVYLGTLISDTTTRSLMYYGNPSSIASDSAPFTWAANDFIRYTFQYEAA
jgi:hypothetical protein